MDLIGGFIGILTGLAYAVWTILLLYVIARVHDKYTRWLVAVVVLSFFVVFFLLGAFS